MATETYESLVDCLTHNGQPLPYTMTINVEADYDTLHGDDIDHSHVTQEFEGKIVAVRKTEIVLRLSGSGKVVTIADDRESRAEFSTTHESLAKIVYCIDHDPVSDPLRPQGGYFGERREEYGLDVQRTTYTVRRNGSSWQKTSEESLLYIFYGNSPEGPQVFPYRWAIITAEAQEG